MSQIAIIGVLGLMICCSSSSSAMLMMGGDDDTSPSPGPSSPAPTPHPPPPEGVANVRYVRLERPSADYPNNIINLAEVEVFDENDVNVASGKTVTGGPGAAHGAGPFARLVDENKSSGNFAHTTGNGDSFMQIDLGSATTVKKVVITNRLNCCQGRTENMKVKLLDADNAVLKTTNAVNKGQKEMTIDFSATAPAWEYLPM
jgi:hypothetical protein